MKFKFLTRNNNYDSIAARIAYNLLYYGTTDVEISYGFIAGYEDIDHVQIFGTSLSCKPYIDINGNPLLWTILKEPGIEINYSGGASKEYNYAQASFSDSSLKGWNVKNLTASQLIKDICLYFSVMKKVKEKKIYT